MRLGREIFDQTGPSRKALAEADAIRDQLLQAEEKLGTADSDLKHAITQAQADIGAILTKKDEGPASPVMGLEKANTGLVAALRVVESGHRAAPSQAIALYQQSSEQAKVRIAEWNDYKKMRLPQLNEKLSHSGMVPIAISEIEQTVQYLMSQ